MKSINKKIFIKKIYDLEFIRTNRNNYGEFIYYYRYSDEYYKMIYSLNENNGNPITNINISIYSKID